MQRNGGVQPQKSYVATLKHSTTC